MKKKTEVWNVEVTDTLGGEANYSWVRRYRVRVPAGASQARIMRAAKAAADFTGSRGETESSGDGYTFRPRGLCVVMFVSWDDFANASRDAHTFAPDDRRALQFTGTPPFRIAAGRGIVDAEGRVILHCAARRVMDSDGKVREAFEENGALSPWEADSNTHAIARILNTAFKAGN
jgi:hypothetical protein